MLLALIALAFSLLTLIFANLITECLPPNDKNYITCNWNKIKDIYNHAAEIKCIKLLQWTHNKKLYIWDKWTCTFAALHGDLKTLKWARQNNYPWTEDVCSYAAQNGHLHIIKWAIQHGCPWDKEILLWATQNYHTHIVKWYKDNFVGNSSC